MRFLFALFAILACGNAWAQDEASSPAEEVTSPAEPKPLDGTIVLVPAGSQVSLLGDDGTSTPYGVPSKYWLLPDLHYRNAVTMGKQLQICEPALDTCTETALQWQDRTYEALNKCSEQFDEDGDQITALITDKEQLQMKLSKTRTREAVAWAIASGLLVGAGTALVVTLSAP